jgi:hypothetical protein
MNFRTLKLFLALALLTVALPLRAQAVTCQATPAIIPITMGYHGMPLEITGESAPGDAVIIKITSAPADIHLKYQGKAAGIFWMKLGTLTFKDIPGTYLVASSGPLDKILSPAEQESNSIGIAALQKKAFIKAEHGQVPTGDWFAEFFEFKEHENNYAIKEGNVKVDPNGGFTLTLDWPFQAQPGDYTVEVITANNGQVTGRADAAIKVEMTGMVATISDLASNHRAVYGIIAIVVALAVGFAVGNIFKKGGGAH